MCVQIVLFLLGGVDSYGMTAILVMYVSVLVLVNFVLFVGLGGVSPAAIVATACHF